MKKIVNLVLAVILGTSLFVKYASLEYFSKAVNYYIYQVPWIRVLIILTSLSLLLSGFFKNKWLNDYTSMILGVLTFFSWISFYKENKVMKFYDTANNMFEINIRKEVFIIPIILIVILVYLIICVISNNKKAK